MENTEARVERTLAITEQITHIGSWEWRLGQPAVRWSDELYRIYGFQPQSQSITPEFFLSLVHPDDRERVQQHVSQAIERGGRFQWSERIVRPDGSVRHLETIGELQIENGATTLFGTCRDITEEQQQREQIQRYADICRNVQIGLCVWSRNGKQDAREFTMVTFNRVAEQIAGAELESLIGARFCEVFPFAVGGRVEALLARVATEDRVQEVEVIAWNPDKPRRTFNFKAFPLPGDSVGLAVLEVTEQATERRLRDAEHQVLESVASGAPLADSLEKLVGAVEDYAPPAIGSILLLDPDAKHVRDAAGRGLPEGFRQAIDGLPIGPRAGSCGTAAYNKSAVFVEDIEADPLWDEYRELARTYGLRACWSTPIVATNQRVLGTFAFYYTSPRRPTPKDLELVGRVTRLAAIAIERAQMEEQLRDLSAHVEAALEAERTRIAREIHHDLGQSLTALKMDIAWVMRRAREAPVSSGQPLLEKLQQMSLFTDDVIQRVRQISADLRPGVLDDLGLFAAIEWQAQAFEDRTGTPCLVRSHQAHPELGRDVATAAFRIVQEALTNIVRHAHAERVSVEITIDDAELSIEVSDDGVGITKEVASSPKSLGLLGIRERAHRLRGEVVVEAIRPRGTCVRLKLPRDGGGKP